MRIGINLLFLTNNTNSSIGKHTEALLNGFRKINLLSDCSLFVRKCYYEKAKSDYPEANIVLIHAEKIMEYLLTHKKKHSDFSECYYLNRFTISKTVKKLQIDVMFHPFNDSTIYFMKKIHNILVIHDLYYLRYPTIYGRFHYLYAKKKHEYFLKNSNAIVAVSEFIKNDILSNIESSQNAFIQVIPNAVATAEKFTNFVPVEEPYILSIASQTYNKNIITLLRAFNLIKKRISHQLVLIGKHKDMTCEIQYYIKKHQLDDRVLCIEAIPDEHRNSLYQHASLLVAPSLCESFGRVPIEAALLKIPVITSRSSALFEVTLGLLTYYDPPTDSQALAMKIIEMLNHPPSNEAREQIAATYARIYDETSIANRYVTLFQPQTRLE